VCVSIIVLKQAARQVYLLAFMKNEKTDQLSKACGFPFKTAFIGSWQPCGLPFPPNVRTSG
jgi:hypothetical protein